MFARRHEKCTFHSVLTELWFYIVSQCSCMSLLGLNVFKYVRSGEFLLDIGKTTLSFSERSLEGPFPIFAPLPTWMLC